MRKAKYILSLLAVILISVSVTGQDLHFSQFFASPLTLTPAETGNFAEDYRVGGNFKQQWPWANDGKNYNYRTFSAYADFGFLHDQLPQGDWLGAGIMVLYDNAGTGNLTQTKIFGSVAYHKMLGLQRKYYLSLGVSGGLVQENINYSKLTFDNQWNDLIFDPNLASGETGSPKLNYFDMAAGLSLNMHPKENMFFSVGVSLNHVTRPYESFYKTEANRLGERPVANITGNIRIKPNWHLEPSLMYVNEKSADEFLASLLAGYHIGNYNKTLGSSIFYFGILYRVNDALAPVVGMQIARIKVLLNYDVNLSSLTGASKAVGGFEMSVVYKGFWPGSTEEHSVPCPRL